MQDGQAEPRYPPFFSDADFRRSILSAVASLCRRYGYKGDPEDVVQETFRRTLQALSGASKPDLSSREKATGYLITVASRYLQELAARGRNRPHIAQGVPIDVLPGEALGAVTEDAVIAHVEAAIQTLRAEYREAATEWFNAARGKSALSAKELAARWGVSEKTVYRLLGRARLALEGALSGGVEGGTGGEPNNVGR